MNIKINTEDLILSNDDIKSKSVKNGIINLIGQIVNFSVTMITTVVLARLLTPGDYGLVALVTAFYTLFLIFNEFGFTISLIRKEHLDNDEVSTILWLNNLISISFTIIFFSFSYLIAIFYADSRLETISQIFSIIFILGGLSSVHNAILVRQMKFKKIIIATILSTIIGMISAISSALYGLGTGR